MDLLLVIGLAQTQIRAQGRAASQRERRRLHRRSLSVRSLCLWTVAGLRIKTMIGGIDDHRGWSWGRANLPFAADCAGHFFDRLAQCGRLLPFGPCQARCGAEAPDRACLKGKPWCLWRSPGLLRGFAAGGASGQAADVFWAQAVNVPIWSPVFDTPARSLLLVIAARQRYAVRQEQGRYVRWI